MSRPTHCSPTESKTNALRTGFLREVARQNPIIHYELAKTGVELRRIRSIVKADIFDKIAAELQDLLLQRWDARSREAITEVIRVLHGRSNLGRGDLATIMRGMRAILGAAFAGDVGGPLLEIQTTAYSQGMQQILQIKPTFKLIDTQAINWLQKHHIFWVHNYFNRQVQDKVVELGERAISQGLSRRDAANLFKDEFDNIINPQSFRYWEGFANHVTTRSREFGRVEGYVRAGITEIEIRAVLDHRTSSICRHMNGRIIQVGDAVELRTKMMNAQTPEDVIQIAPFMRPDDVLGVATSDLKSKSAGFALPPYHYDCRTRTVKRRTVSEQNTVTDTQRGQRLNDQDYAKLSDLTHEEQSNVLQAMRSKTQLQYNRSDFDSDFQKHAPAFGISNKKEYRLRATSNMKQASHIQSFIYKDEKQYRFFGPDGVTYIDSAFQIRGFFFHADATARQRAFNGMQQTSLWLKTSDNS